MRSNSPRFSVLASVVALFTVQLAVSPTPSTIHNRVTPTVPAHQNFIPTWIFEGSDLRSSQRVGSAQWKAANGELSVSGGPGIIVAKNAMQDYAFAADFKCEAACNPGILLRTETHDGNPTGILISLASDDIALYRASLSGDGTVASREALFVRPKDASPTPVPPDTGVDIPGSPGVYEARPVSQYNPPRPQPPAPTVKIGEWNHIESYIYEQIRGDDGEIHFTRHPIMSDFANRAEHHDVAFPALHALALADVNHDGLMDIIAGRRWYGHFDAFNDPDTHGEPVLYWWQLVRKPGGNVDWIPHLIDNHSGGGTNITAVDLNGDGRADVLTATRKGVFIFFSGAGKGNGTTTALRN